MSLRLLESWYTICPTDITDSYNYLGWRRPSRSSPTIHLTPLNHVLKNHIHMFLKYSQRQRSQYFLLLQHNYVLITTEYRGINTTLVLLAALFLMQTWMLLAFLVTQTCCWLIFRPLSAGPFLLENFLVTWRKSTLIHMVSVQQLEFTFLNVLWLDAVHSTILSRFLIRTFLTSCRSTLLINLLSCAGLLRVHLVSSSI